MPFEPAQLGAGLEIPQPQRPVLGPRERAPPVGQHRHAGDPVLVPLEAAQLGAGLEIPQPQRPVLGPRERAPPVGQQRHAGDPASCPASGAALGACSEIPQPQRPSSGPRERAPPVGQHRRAGDPALMPRRSGARGSPPCSEIPQPQRAVAGPRQRAPAVGQRKGEAWCAGRMQSAANNDTWVSRGGYKVLALEHKLVATRGDFLDVYTAMTLIDPDAAAPSGSGENKGPAAARMLLDDLAQLAACVDSAGAVNDFAATDVLRRAGCLENLPAELEKRTARTEQMLAAVSAFGQACANPHSTVADVIGPILDAHLFEGDGRLRRAFADKSPPPSAPVARGEKETTEARMGRGWYALFGAPWAELARYRSYLGGKSELATHQVVKGSEFEHVMVVMDDSQAGGSQISYDKLFGGKELSNTDLANVKEGKETTIDRSLRLL